MCNEMRLCADGWWVTVIGWVGYGHLVVSFALGQVAFQRQGGLGLFCDRGRGKGERV